MRQVLLIEQVLSSIDGFGETVEQKAHNEGGHSKLDDQNEQGILAWLNEEHRADVQRDDHESAYQNTSELLADTGCVDETVWTFVVFGINHQAKIQTIEITK